MHPLCPMPVQSIIFNMSAAICCHTNSAWEKSCNRDLKKLAFSVQKSLKSSNVIKLVRKGAHQRESGAQKGQKELRGGKIDNKTGRRGLHLKKEYEKGFGVRRRNRRKCGCP